jgi:hypothetical protein
MPVKRIWLTLFSIMHLLSGADAAPKQVRVFVALCDNATQGIIKVGARIGDGNKPDDNLYWGCSDGLRSYFKASKQWKLTNQEKFNAEVILERCEFTHSSQDVVLVADAYRGAQMKQCIEDFEACIRAGEANFVAFIGHNGLMDFRLPLESASPTKKSAVAVLCCHSESYFKERITAQGGSPVLLTAQLMYPGSFLLHDALESWRTGGDAVAMREAAAKAYAKNQKISVKAARGVFAGIKKS